MAKTKRKRSNLNCTVVSCLLLQQKSSAHFSRWFIVFITVDQRRRFCYRWWKTCRPGHVSGQNPLPAEVGRSDTCSVSSIDGRNGLSCNAIAHHISQVLASRSHNASSQVNCPAAATCDECSRLLTSSWICRFVTAWNQYWSFYAAYQ